MADLTADRLAIRDIVENWVLWRDARAWERFRTLWHPEGEMWATWFQGGYENFIKVSQEGFERGARIVHMLGGTTIDIEGNRAIGQTKLTINQRALVEGVLCDVACMGRAYDFLEKRDGRWGIVRRRHTYEKRPHRPGRTRRQNSRSTGTCWRNSRKAIAISPICRLRSVTR